MKLHQLITQYVTFRQSMGEDFESSERLLMTFCRRMGAEIDINDLHTEQVEVFLAGTGSLSGYWRRKYNLLRGLYRYAISRDLVADAPLPKTVPRLPQRFLPIFIPKANCAGFSVLPLPVGKTLASWSHRRCERS
jgi:integrase/recombinase XerD